MRSSWFIAVLTPSLFVATVAHAAGSYVGDIEAYSMGQGGATIASPATLGAFYYNPAALAGQQGLRLQVEGGFQFTPLTYQRDPNEMTGETYRLVTNTNPFKIAMFGAVTYDFGVKDLAVGIAAYSPTAGSYVYTDNGAQRYDNISANNTVFHLHLGVAYRPFSWLSLGVTFGNTYFRTIQRVALSASVTDNAEDPAFSVPIQLDVNDPFTITSNFGVRFEPLKQLAIGVSIMPPFDIQASGNAQVFIPSALSSLASVSGDKVDLSLRLPMILRAGIRYRPIEMLAVEAAFVWQQWSRNDTITLAPQDLRVTALGMEAPLPQIQLQKQYQDSYSARLGVEVTPIGILALRAGGFFESSAVKKERFDISSPDTNKFGVSVGASLDVWKFSLDAAYVAIIAPAVNVSNSQKTVINVLNLNGPASPMGNGQYTFGYHMVHFGVRASFFDEPKSAPPSEEPATSEPSTTPSP